MSTTGAADSSVAPTESQPLTSTSSVAAAPSAEDKAKTASPTIVAQNASSGVEVTTKEKIVGETVDGKAGGGEEEEEVLEGNWAVPKVEVHEVKVQSGEEDEETVWKHRAKLLRWALDASEDNYIWKERGLGDAKLLRHKESGKIRFLLRQEKTLKIVANHFVIEQNALCKLKVNSGSDKIWCWSANDFADGELKLEHFALRFGQVEQANLFKEKFESSCRDNAKTFNIVAPPDATNETSQTKG